LKRIAQVSSAIPKLDAPIVLVPGLRGFETLFNARRPAKDAFPGVRSVLEVAGNTVLTARVSPTASVATRAGELKAYLQNTLGSRPVHLIGHSMGGLDARYMISKLGMDRKVLTLTSVATPHRGTTFADWILSRFARYFCPLLRSLGIPDGGFFDLTTDACQRFNEEVIDAPNVRYAAVAGVCETPWLGAEWAFSSRIVGRAEGPNDGVVSVASATWGERTDVWVGDHLNLVNWPNRKMKKAGEWHDRAADYGRLLDQFAPRER